MKVDGKKKTLSLSAKDVVYASGSKVIHHQSHLPNHVRAVKGIEIHQKYQKSENLPQESKKIFKRQAFESKNEVAIKINRKISNWKVTITGRADVVRESAKIILVEEIKSITDLEKFALDSNIAEQYIQQLLIYGTYFAEKFPNKTIHCQIVLIEINTEKQQTIAIPFEDMSVFIYTQIKQILQNWTREEKFRLKKQTWAPTITFPFSQFRKNQQEIMTQAQTMLKKRKHLVLSAPAGLGKTVGTLVPALKYTLQHNKLLFIVTSKTTQSHIYEETLRLMAKQGAKFNAIFLMAKEKMCLNGVYMCDPVVCPFIRDYSEQKIDLAITTMLKNKVITPKYIRTIAKKHQLCPFELALDCSLGCDVIVGDYNYVFNPTIQLKRYFSQKYDNVITIVDEAHNLPDRARAYYSPELSLEEIQKTTEFLKASRISPVIRKQGLEILHELAIYLKSFKKNTKRNKSNPTRPSIVEIDKKFMRDVLKAFDDFLLLYVPYIMKGTDTFPPAGEQIVHFDYSLRQFVTILKESDQPEYTRLFYPGSNTLTILCKSAANKLKKQMKGFHAVIFQSATLFPINFYRNMLGLQPENSECVVYPSPFPKTNRKYLVVSQLSTRYENREDSYRKIAATIQETLNIHPGNYLAFFPSFRYLEAVRTELEQDTFALPVKKIIVQTPNMPEAKRKKILKKLKDRKENYLVLGVHGGIFSEGVDYEGDMAVGAFVIGPGLPAYCFEQELVKIYFDNTTRKGFEFAYRNPGMTRVIQAAGRIFRSQTDKGVILLLGQRFTTPYYRSVLPSDWDLDIPQNFGEFQHALTDFWAQP
ncbi:MAG: ATP-dependent DNA helicase [Promethearchaeota archaeon]